MSEALTQRATRPPLWRELVGGLLVFGVYLWVDSWQSPARRALADFNASQLVDIQQWLHIDVERPLNAWLAPHHVLSTIANYEYAFTYVISAFALLGWLYVRSPSAYRQARASFVVLNLVGIACFAAFPTTPPRLLAELGLVDTVTRGGTFGSWGMPLVTNANQLAAMPSLHVAWALWVSVVLARLYRRAATRVNITVQVISAIHVAVTVYVILATANHYLLDAVAAVLLVWLSIALVDRWTGGIDGRVPATDAFFLHVENAGAPQHVGGTIMLAPTLDGSPTLAQMRELVRGELGHLPRFTQRIVQRSRRLRPRWVPAAEIDWEWHVSERHLDAPSLHAGRAALDSLVAELAATPLPRDRPMWRIVMARGVGPGRSVMILLVHHCVADGIGTVMQALQLLRPRLELPAGGEKGSTALWRKGLATVVGLGQLATDGRPAVHLRGSSGQRGFATALLDLAQVQAVARAAGARVTDVLLMLVAEAVGRAQPTLSAKLAGRLRVAVPLMVRSPGVAAEGNVTAAVMVDVPTGAMSRAARLAHISRRTARLRTPTRALASRFVMARVLEPLPEPFVAWFARTVYGARFFQAIVSNMPGPRSKLTLAEVPIEDVVPIIPLALGAPLAVGVLSWNGVLGVGLATDPASVDAVATAQAMHDVLAVAVEDLDGTRQASAEPQASAKNIRARDVGESSSSPNRVRN